jgi:cytochrome c553
MKAETISRVHTCASCHGSEGISSAEIFPNLAGQQKDYIAEQLTAFRDHTRQDRDAKSYMWGMAAGLDDATIGEMAAYYSAKTPAAGTKDPDTDISEGQAIFEKGVAAHGVLACSSCHGAHAEGAAAFPRLAGQKKDYLMVQLDAFASGSRDNAVMHPIAKAMTPEEIESVATYLSSL